MSDSTNLPEEVSPETSARICQHMNQDHAATVLGMALSTLPFKEENKHSVSRAQLTKVTLSECRLSYVVCQGNACAIRAESYPFEPPLTSASEVKPRLIKIHDEVLSPDVWWLRDPMALLILLICGSALYAKLAYTGDQIIEMIEGNPAINEKIIAYFGSVSIVPKIISLIVYVSAVGHLTEAFFVVYHCKKTLKLGFLVSLKWFLLVACVGFKILGRFNVLLNAQVAAKAKEKGKSSKASKKAQ